MKKQQPSFGHNLPAPTKVELAIGKLIELQPFWGIILTRMNRICLSGKAEKKLNVETIGVRLTRQGFIEFIYSETFVNRVTVIELIECLKHEAIHIAQCHWACLDF